MHNIISKQCSLYSRSTTYRNVLGELCTDNTVGSVTTHDLSPNATKVRAVLLNLASVDVGNLLAKVEVACFLVVHTIDLDQSGVGVGVSATSTILTIKIS